jgi:hypothetical protein
MASARIRRNFNVGLIVASAACLAPACAASNAESSADAGKCVGLSCGPNDAGHDQVVADVWAPDSSPDTGPPTQNPLCGSGCLPDDGYACPSAGGGGAGGAAGAGNAPDAATELDAGADGDAGPPVPPPAEGCGVSADKSGSPVAACAPAGSGESGAPCVSEADCRAGLACVGEGNAGQCRPYCCLEPDPCATDTYCAERKQKADLSPGQTPLVVPVCVPADKCSLDEPYPCPAGTSCKCKDGTACTVVKDDGTTSCVPPGTGHAGDKCPCAAGYLCSQASTTCLKLCSTNAATPECGSGKCVSVAYLPAGYGVCGL